ncbi:MAG: HypC/HybG/HupF family hydrogenase formation chaperone [Actinotalea sp.]|nr:HypC/HybG/HupF family hydrogenase formation chaperone [Actinotalea sp.]
MCLGEVARVVRTLPDRVVETEGTRRARVSVLTLDGPVEAGDWLLVHSGFALRRLTDPEARAALALRGGMDEPPRDALHAPLHDPTRRTDVPAVTPTGGPT